MKNYTSDQYSALLIRIAFGIILLSHGLLKIFVFKISGTVAFFASLSLPAIIAYLTIFAETVGGVAIILGIYTKSHL